MTTTNQSLQTWVDQVAQLTSPDKVVWCDGSDQEYDALVEQMNETGTLSALNQETHPNCFLHLSDPQDVARVEHLTFICTTEKEDAGKNNNWMDISDAKEKMQGLFKNCMNGRTM